MSNEYKIGKLKEQIKQISLETHEVCREANNTINTINGSPYVSIEDTRRNIKKCLSRKEQDILAKQFQIVIKADNRKTTLLEEIERLRRP